MNISWASKVYVIFRTGYPWNGLELRGALCIYSYSNITSKFGKIKTFSQRSNIRHKNILVRIIYMLVYAFPQFIGIAEDDLQIIKVPLFEHVDNQVFVIDTATITLKPEYLRFYTAHLTTMAQLEGLQYYMKKWFVSTLLIVVSLMTVLGSAMLFLAIFYLWRIVKNRIQNHMDYRRRENSMLKLYILRSIF